MSKFNTGTVRIEPRSSRGGVAMTTKSVTPDARTHEGGSGFAFDERTDLFFLLSGSFITEKAFYEGGDDRVDRARRLIRVITDADKSADKAESGAWFAAFTKWLRTKAFIRTGSVVLAAEAAKARVDAKAPGFTRDIVSAALDRGDEPGEFIGYWLSRFGKTIPIGVKRGVADAVVRLYNEYSTLRYDTASHAIRFGDVVELVNPRTNASTSAGLRNDALMRHLIDRGKSYNYAPIPKSLEMLTARRALDEVPVVERRALLGETDRFKMAGMSWETLASWLQGPMDARAWETIAPTMGYMALLRNLRNFDEQGMSKAVAAKVAARIADPAQVEKSRQLPFRFWTAYREVANDRWKVALGDALETATQNIPDSLGGRTLVLVDTSGSMTNKVSERSSVTMMEVGALFAVAMSMKFGVDNVDLVEFASTSQRYALRKGASVLDQVSRFCTGHRVGHGTDIHGSVVREYKGQDRVVLVSDMQTFGGGGGFYSSNASRTVPTHVPFYAFNLGGYSTTAVGGEKNRFQLGGLSDKTFSFMETTERGVKSGWPWEVEQG